MSRTPFSRPDVDDLVSGSHVFKKRFSLNNRLRARLPKARVKHLFGIVVVVLFLFGSQLTACGYSTVSPTGSGSPTSNTTSIPNTPGSRSGPGSTSASTSTAGPTTHPTVIPTTNPTAGPTTRPTAVPTTHPTVIPTTNPTAEPTTDPTAGPTTDPTAVPTAPPSSFTVSERQFTLTGSAGQSDPDVQHITLMNNSNPILPLIWSVKVTPDSADAWLRLNPSGDTLDKLSEQIDLIASNLKAHLQPGSYNANLLWKPVNPDPNVDNSVLVTLTVVPSVSSVSQASGPATGGTSVTISGSGFTGATGVSFGATAAGSFKVDSDTQIMATSPAGSGTVDVTVTDTFGTSLTNTGDQFTYNSVPTVSGISPPMGPAVGGTNVTITGSGFTGATSVSFGPTAASSFTVNSDTQITATSPAGSGTVDVIITTPNGTSATGSVDQFTYILTPTVVPSPTPTNTPTPTPTTAPSPTPTDTPTPVPPTPTPTDTPTPIPSNTPTPTSIPSMTAHNRFLFRH